MLWEWSDTGYILCSFIQIGRSISGTLRDLDFEKVQRIAPVSQSPAILSGAEIRMSV
jgi:hypothetical protein